jgi:hypothetical protein
MIRKLLILCLLLLTALTAAADETQTVLTSDGVVYTVDSSSRTQLRLIRRVADERSTIVVPTTEDTAIESQAQLLWDNAASTLYVVWHRSTERIDQILLSRLDAEGNWADPTLIATGQAAKRAGLQVAMTKVGAGASVTTLIHAAWWSINDKPVAEYALLAFENGEFLSVTVDDLQELAGANGVYDDDTEPVTEVLHPPLAMARGTGASVDVVFGSPYNTRLTRIVLEPRRVRPDVRIWKPSRKGGGVTPRAGLMSASGDPVKVILNQGRIVLYTPDNEFRFVMYQNGQWTPERMIRLDAKLTREQMVQELNRTVEQLEIADEQTASSQGVTQ